MERKEHNINKVCKSKGCGRLGSPSICQDCEKPQRRGWCAKHRKHKELRVYTCGTCGRESGARDGHYDCDPK